MLLPTPPQIQPVTLTVQKGINLHFDMTDADEIPHQNSITVYEIVNGTWYPTWSGFDKIKDEWFGMLLKIE